MYEKKYEKMNDETFISKWKPIHVKTMAKHVILGSFIDLLIVSLITSIIIWISPRSHIKIDYLIITIVLLFLMLIGRRISDWFIGEKRYRKIMNKKL